MTTISNVNQCVATIRSIEAQLSSLALNSQEVTVQRTFHDMMNIMNEIKKDLQYRVNEMVLEEPQYKQT
ncbi:DUF1657 domain-containing protein [Cytobacillus solani]|uniref:Uncharacterized protein n=1 Tax=Cytobacillus solani TaxID=1637975 RepID=A0A0Q3VHC9_9BACI|nr:DUF1657 domain-containing protein [Cytobacillus solani]KOP82931.1 hypothetical protein AMS60_10900 [Bacillus sp. FJAT-21945]KQL19955.1 hypothetical protein AN957_16205 [Cytobacillus solani]USK53198.1 DUF1657 domain-containing protein [Cytobacillus solani]